MDKVEDFKEKKRKYLAKTIMNRRLVRGVFKDLLVKELLIPCFINDYN